VVSRLLGTAISVSNSGPSVIEKAT